MKFMWVCSCQNEVRIEAPSNIVALERIKMMNWVERTDKNKKAIVTFNDMPFMICPICLL